MTAVAAGVIFLIVAGLVIGASELVQWIRDFITEEE